MSTTLVMTALGRDRVGIVADVADLLYKLGCNLLDSSMTLLRGEFAIILMVELPEQRTVPDLELALKELAGKTGLNIHVRELTEQELMETTLTGKPHIISVYGADRPGIVAGVARRLADLGVNITDVETKSTDSEKGSVFVMILEVMVPDKVPTERVEQALAEASRELAVDVSVQALEVYEL